MENPFSFRLLRPLIVVALLAVSVTGAASRENAAVEQYHNGTYGFTLRLPGGLAEYQTVTSPDGIMLTSPDGMVAVNIFGSWNPSGKPLTAIVEQYMREVPNARFTYEWYGRNAAVLSGFQDGDIFYMRIAMSPDGSRVAVVNMIYARELKEELDPVVTRLSTSLSIR